METDIVDKWVILMDPQKNIDKKWFDLSQRNVGS